MPREFGYTVDELLAASSEDAVVGRLLERGAREAPDEVFVQFEDGTSWTRAHAWDIARSAAETLRANRIGFGDRVGVFQPNGPAFLATWWGTALVGGILVPLNTAFRGAVLERTIRTTEPPIVVTAPDLAERLDEIEVDVVRIDAGAMLEPREISTEPFPEVNLWDDQVLVQTSGTTGPSKFVRVSHLSPYAGYASILASQGCTSEDVFQIDLPLFHMAALGYVHACLITRCRMVVRSRPAMDRYWEAIRDDGITCGILLSSMVPFMLSRPVSAAEHEHGIRFLISAPVPPDVAEFKERFRIPKLLSPYGSTEQSAPLIGEAVPGLPQGYCGQVRPGWEVRLVDENEQEVPVGEAGEAMVRAVRPFLMSSGYFRNPEVTAQAWRHGWFHTGDLLRRNHEGRFAFVDRSGDAIRRRGENISAFEVEAAIATHPDVAEVACIPVRSDSGVDHEIKAWVVPTPGVEIDFADVFRHCAETMPHFMVPRYFETAADLPKTPSAKVQKYLLRDRGNTATTWDSREHGLVVTRRGLESA